MKSLINIEKNQIGNEVVNSVNARDLYKTLEIKQEFANWIKKQINSLGLEENINYIRFDKKVKPNNNAIQKEYIITLDTAKHISMASRTAKGKEVRNYFIEVEKNFTQNEQLKYADKIYHADQIVSLDDADLREAIFLGHNGKCFYTKNRLSKRDFHIDHVLPVSRGGRDCISNLVPCFPHQNLIKGSRVLDDMQTHLLDIHHFHNDIVIEIYNIFKSAQEIQEKHNRVSFSGLKKNVMDDFDRRFGKNTMTAYYSKVFGIPYNHSEYENKIDVFQFMSQRMDNTNANWKDMSVIYKDYKSYCSEQGIKEITISEVRNILNLKLGKRL